jgi:hypothetical protein
MKNEMDSGRNTHEEYRNACIPFVKQHFDPRAVSCRLFYDAVSIVDYIASMAGE